MRQAWIAGATGLVGHLLSEKLSLLGVYQQVYAIVRAGSTPPASGGTPVVLNYDQLKIEAEPESDFFCCLGTTIKKAGSQEAFRLVDETYVIRFAEEAKKSNAHCFVVISAAGAHARSSVFYSRVKGQMETSVKNLGLRSVYVLRPGLLLGERKEKRALEGLAIYLAPVMSTIAIGPLRRYRPIQASRVAEIAMQCAAQARPGFHVLEGFE